jgi:hypothetical protein
VRAALRREEGLTMGSVVVLREEVAPTRRPNAELRTREHLTEREVERLIEAAKSNPSAVPTARSNVGYRG